MNELVTYMTQTRTTVKNGHWMGTVFHPGRPHELVVRVNGEIMDRIYFGDPFDPDIWAQLLGEKYPDCEFEVIANDHEDTYESPYD